MAADEAEARGEAPAAAPSEVDTQSNQEASTEKPSGLFYDVDPNTLTPELRQMFDGMQKAFTQKNQELAEQRKQLESFGDIEQVGQAVQFVQSLNDPQNLVQLHTELSEYLQQAGYTKADADAAAASAINEQQADPEPDYGFDDPQVAQLQKELDSLKSWREQFEAEQEQSRIEAQIERTELQLRQDRGYDDADVSRLYQLAYAHGGDLVSAANAYDAWKNELIGSYVNSKAEAPGAGTVVPNSVLGQVPQTFGDDFEAAHKYAKNLIQTMQAAGELD